jgi:uncharacterized glyoxalase superfamily protein PhnB
MSPEADDPIMLAPDTEDEADAPHATLSEGGEAHTPMRDELWGDDSGARCDRFDVRWMIDVAAQHG